jgi:mycothiol synthase
MITMTTHRARPYAGEADLPALLALQHLTSRVDGLEEHLSETIDDWRQWLTAPGVQPERDLRIWEDETGRQVAHGTLWIPDQHTGDEFDGGFGFRVHPDVRGDRDLEDEIVGWAEATLRRAGAGQPRPLVLQGFGMEQQTYNRAVLEAHDYTVTRYFFVMRRPFTTPIPAPQFPAGYTLRYVENDADLERWVEMFNLSFIDHWGFHPATVERRRHRMSSPHYRREGDLIGVAPDGTFAGFCACFIDDAANAQSGRNEGWIHVLGTRRGQRGQGLGRAMLLAGLHRLRQDGMDTAVLNVDAENGTGALGLYEGVGFQVAFRLINYCKELTQC